MRRHRPALPVAAVPVLALVAATVLAGCGSSGTSSAASGSAAASGDRPSVVAAFYPLQFAAESVAGDTADVSVLTPPGVEPHDLELSPAQVAQITDADLVLYVKGFQPAVDEAIEQQAADRALDVSSGLPLIAGADHADAAAADAHADEHGASDPHVWLDPANMAAIGTAIAERLASLSPGNVDTITANAEDLTAQMTQLDDDFTTALATCASRDLVVSHEAFGYLAQAYDLTQIGISGLSPEAEPSPARLREVADLVESQGITTIYYETLVDPKVAQTLADETGAQTAVLDPLEGLAEGSSDDYTSAMLRNLDTLVIGQGCT